MVAFTMSKFIYKVFPQEGEAIINTSAVFYPCKSWINIANVKGDIAHEQLHFAITEYYRRLFLKNLSEVNTSSALLKTNIKNLFTQLAIERRDLDKLYDAATGFGEKKEEQIKWENKIENMLLSLLSFEPQTITITLK